VTTYTEASPEVVTREQDDHISKRSKSQGSVKESTKNEDSPQKEVDIVEEELEQPTINDVVSEQPSNDSSGQKEHRQTIH